MLAFFHGWCLRGIILNKINEKESQTKINNDNKILIIVSLLILIMIDKINQKLPKQFLNLLD